MRGFFGSPRPATPVIETPRLILRAPTMEDHEGWARLRRQSAAFLKPWDPAWATDALSARAFRKRVDWARRGAAQRAAWPLLALRQEDEALIGGLTLDNIRRGAARAGTLGYWIGAPFVRRGYMTEAVAALTRAGFAELGLSRIEAACLPENAASRALLARCGFVEEGRAAAYLQIQGVWRDHILHAALAQGRADGAPAGG